MPEINLSMTAREKLVKPYLDRNEPHEFRTTPVSVTGQFVANVVAGANGICWAVFAKQTVKVGRKGMGDDIAYGRTLSEAQASDTNLQRGGSTDGARDMAIEGIQISGLGSLVDYYGEATPAAPLWGTAPTNETIVAALQGTEALIDPFGLVVPAQLQSPYLLEDTLYQSLMARTSVELVLDTSRPFRLGCARLFPGSAGASMLKSSGLPEVANSFLFKEGILWQRDGQADSDLVVNMTLDRPLVLAMSQVTFPGGNAVATPLHVYQRFAIDLLGVSVSPLAVN